MDLLLLYLRGLTRTGLEVLELAGLEGWTLDFLESRHWACFENLNQGYPKTSCHVGLNHASN